MQSKNLILRNFTNTDDKLKEPPTGGVGIHGRGDAHFQCLHQNLIPPKRGHFDRILVTPPPAFGWLCWTGSLMFDPKAVGSLQSPLRELDCGKVSYARTLVIRGRNRSAPRGQSGHDPQVDDPEENARARVRVSLISASRRTWLHCPPPRYDG